MKKACVLMAILVGLATFLGVFIPNTQAARIIIQDRNLPMNYECLDNETLNININSSKDGFDNYTVSCPNGCEENLGKYGADCVEPEYLITLWVIIGIVVLFFLILFAMGRRR